MQPTVQPQAHNPQQQRTRDLDEAMRLVGQVYCPHTLRLRPLQRSVDARLSVAAADGGALVSLAYGAEVEVDAGHFDDIFLIMQCTGGHGSVRQDGELQHWGQGSVMPVSMNRATQFRFERSFTQTSLRPDARRLQALCAAWIGRPLEQDLRFELRPFSAQLASAWSAMLGLLGQAAGSYSAAARQSLEEALLGMLLAGHGHNYSAAMQTPDEHASRGAHASARLARRFEQLARDDQGQSLSVAAIAQRLDVGIRTLQSATERHLNTTPSTYLRELRLARVQRELSQGSARTGIADVAYAHGFVHLGRFSAFYKTRFGEKPSDTLARARNRDGASAP